MTRLSQLAEEWAKERGLACLVPLSGKGGITSHEGHHCDCQVTMAFAHGLRAGLDMAIMRGDKFVSDNRENGVMWWEAANDVVEEIRSLLEEGKA